MEQNQATPRRAATQPTRRQRRIRRRLRLVRNWVLFLGACAGAMVLMTTGILWLLPKAHALIAGPEVFEAQQYDGSAYTLDLADGRLALVNANLPLTAEPTPELAVADDATGQQLEAEAAQQYRTMAEAARNSGIALTLETGVPGKRPLGRGSLCQSGADRAHAGGQRVRHRIRGGYSGSGQRSER